MLSCRDVTELITLAREDALAGDRLAAFSEHLSLCGDCRAYQGQLDEAVEIAREVPPEPVPTEVEGRLLAAFRGRKA